MAPRTDSSLACTLPGTVRSPRGATPRSGSLTRFPDPAPWPRHLCFLFPLRVPSSLPPWLSAPSSLCLASELPVPAVWSPHPGSQAIGPRMAALLRRREGAAQVPGGAAGDYVKSPRCGDLAVLCAPLSWDVLAGPVFPVQAAEVPALCALGTALAPPPSPNPSFPGLPRLPAWEAVVPSRRLHALTFPWRTPC